MDINDAIVAHIRWRTALSHYVANPDGSLCPAEVASTDRCALGRWLMGEGKDYRGVPEFDQLVSSHEFFHRAASAIVRKADSGEAVLQDIALGLQSGYGAASSEIVKSLMRMRTRMAMA